MRLRSRSVIPAAIAAAAALLSSGAATAQAAGEPGGHAGAAVATVNQPVATVKQPVATGFGGAVSTVDLDASEAALGVLKRGGNAVDAAVAAAAVLGVTEPYSAGIGGGGFFTVYDARRRTVHTLDGRETAPAAMGERAFVDPATGQPLPFAEAVTSGLSAGVPGTALTWDRALRRWGTLDLDEALAPAAEVAERGFVVDETFRQQTLDNKARFADIVTTRELYLPGGDAPAVGSVFRNPDLAQTYRTLGRRGVDWLYRGELAGEIVATVTDPPVDPASARVVRPGLMTAADLAAYRVIDRAPTRVRYRGLEVYGMAPPSSGGSTVGEALNILGDFRLSPRDTTRALHLYLESTRYAFADRNRYVGDPAYVDVPLKELLSKGFARERACLIDPDKAATSPVAPGSPDGRYRPCAAAAAPGAPEPHEVGATTHLVTADRFGNVVAYNLTIEQTGGNGIVVPGRGFLLNNELTDFSFVPLFPGVPDPNLPAPGKRPRSSMAPTIVLDHGRPVLALGSPGGATIITTVAQILVNRVDLGMSLPEALAAPRASQRNGTTQAEPAFLAEHGAALTALGHAFASVPEIGAATALEFLGRGQIMAVAEPTRRGGGSALVVRPAR